MALKELTATIDFEQEMIKGESITEYFRDVRRSPSDLATVAPAKADLSVNLKRFKDQEQAVDINMQLEPPKSDELEALWPGVHHDSDLHLSPRRSSIKHLSIAFALGAATAFAAVGAFTGVQHNVVVSKPADTAVTGAAPAIVRGISNGGTIIGEVLVPATHQYQVQPGDTLAAIASRNYKRVSPRLLDEICRANNMRNANVLSLGQKLNLPEYKPSNQVASTAAAGQL